MNQRTQSYGARGAGKEVEVFLGNAGLKEYLVAAAADRIYIEEGSELRLAGLREARYYLRGTLDKIGIEGELFAKGKYKSAPETFTRRGPSGASKEASSDCVLWRKQFSLTSKNTGRFRRKNGARFLITQCFPRKKPRNGSWSTPSTPSPIARKASTPFLLKTYRS
ncbi:MAG: S49 family peptidase [Bdellovibrionaceae bacterium]|nr:S49 family peptidase [Pseudobdellovibrionaceae bacterium]